MTELIDTLWNVNEINVFLGFYHAQELIDTLWNVNINDTLFLCDIPQN